jgi:hypothetical protein
VLWSHGFLDANTKPDNLTALYPLLRGPKRAWVGQFVHRTPSDSLDPAINEQWLAESFLWLDAYVKGDPAARRKVAKQPRAIVQQGDGRWRPDSAWPPADARPATFALRSGSFTNYPTDDGSQHHGDGVVWSFSQPLPYAVHISGVPRVSLGASAGQVSPQIVVKVYDVDPDGAATFVTRGAYNGVTGQVSYDLYPQDWRFVKGHRIGVAILGNDNTWFHNAVSGQVTVAEASLTVRALSYDREYGPFVMKDLNEPKPNFTIASAVVKAGTTTFRLPPRMKRR